jgi:hypothetical protein
MKSDISYYTTSAQDACYDTRMSVNVMQCKWMEYCMHCFQCEHCFACCGLSGKKYCILNKQYSPEEYAAEKARIIASMRQTGEYGRFFPGHFAPTPYEETIAGFYWPLTREEQRTYGFRIPQNDIVRSSDAMDSSLIPDHAMEATSAITKQVFWDHTAKRPFQIQEGDIAFSKDNAVPLPNCYYSRRLQDNFRLIPFDGTLRTVACGKCQRETGTSWPIEYNGRILCEECYLKEVY